MHSSTWTRKGRTSLLNKEAAVLLTLEPEGMVREITTYPSGRFNRVESYISIYVDKEWWGLEYFGKNEIRFKDFQHTYEGVLIQLELQTGEFKAFMIAAEYGKFLEEEDRTVIRWRWHYWRVSPEDASTILSGELKESDLAVERLHRAIKDPKYAQELDSETHQSHVSISIAKDYLRIVNEDIVIAHMHLAQILSNL
jgi:hypothetical protein